MFEYLLVTPRGFLTPEMRERGAAPAPLAPALLLPAPNSSSSRRLLMSTSCCLSASRYQISDQGSELCVPSQFSVFLGQIKSRPHHENLLCLFFSLCRMYFVRKNTNVTETINWKKAGWPELELLMAKSSSWVTLVSFSILNSCVQLN